MSNKTPYIIFLPLMFGNYLYLCKYATNAYELLIAGTITVATIAYVHFIQPKDIIQLSTISFACFCGYVLFFVCSVILEKVFAIVDISQIFQNFLILLTCCVALFWATVISSSMALTDRFFSMPTRKIVIGLSALYDSRLLGLIHSGLLDKEVVIPYSFVSELYKDSRSDNTAVRVQAIAALDSLKKIQSLRNITVTFYYKKDINKHCFDELVAVAYDLHASILISDAKRALTPNVDNVQLVNMHNLEQLMQTNTKSGSVIQVRIQHSGKESGQGIGYLDDGSMVVVNGAEAYLGENKMAKILSVKSTSIGRKIIFCNVHESEDECVVKV